MIVRLAAALLAWAGWRRLAAGYCPACYSSPPTPACRLCEGEYEYGAGLDPQTRDLWAQRWSSTMALFR